MFLIVNLFIISTIFFDFINANLSSHFNVFFKPSLDIKLTNISREIALYGILFNQHTSHLEHTYLIGNISKETFSFAIKQHGASITFDIRNPNNYENKCVSKKNILTLETYKCLPQLHGILAYVENFPINIKYIFEEISLTYERDNNSFGFKNYKTFIFKVNRKVNDGSGFISIHGNYGTIYQAYIRDPYLPYDNNIIKNYVKEYNLSLSNIGSEKSSNIINFFGEVLNKIDTTMLEYLLYLKNKRPLKGAGGNIKESNLIKRFSSGNRSIDFYFFKNDGVFYEIDCLYNKKKIDYIKMKNELKIPFNRYDFQIGKQLQVQINITTLLNGNIFYEVIEQSFIIFNDKPTTNTTEVIYRNKMATFECPDSGSEPIINKIWSFKKLSNGYAVEINQDIEEYGSKFYFEKVKNHFVPYHSILHTNSTEFQIYGNIQCTVINEFGEGTISYRVIELEKMKSFLSFSVNKTEIQEGDTIMLNCTSFRKDQNKNLQIYAPPLNGHNKFLESISISPYQQIFIIQKARPQDSGEYSCFVNTYDGFIMEEKLQIYVHQSEVIFPDGKDFTKHVDLGKDVTLDCPMIVQSFSFVQWSFINETNPDRTRKSINETEGNILIQENRSLTIQHMTINNAGKYIFEVHFDDRKEECHFRIYTNFKDPEVKIKQINDHFDIDNKRTLKQKEIIKVGEPISITCIIDYGSAINANASLVKKNGSINIELDNIIKHQNNKIRKLSFYKKNASLTDNGDYFCIATTFYFNKIVIGAKTKIVVVKDENDKNSIISKECNIIFPEIQIHKTIFFVFLFIGMFETLLLIGFIYIYISTTMIHHKRRRPKRF